MRFLLLCTALAFAGLAACGRSTPPAAVPANTTTAGTSGAAGASSGATGTPSTDDPYLWLEDVSGERAMAWVKERNAVAAKELEAVPGFASMQARLLAIYDSKERIPYVGVRGKWLYNLWQDEANPRGLWRRTTLA